MKYRSVNPTSNITQLCNHSLSLGTLHRISLGIELHALSRACNIIDYHASAVKGIIIRPNIQSNQLTSRKADYKGKKFEIQ